VYWVKTYGGEGYDYAYSIKLTSDGGYIVAGNTSSFGAGRIDFWILKLFPNGDIEWQKTYGDPQKDSPSLSNIQETKDGGYIVVGYTESHIKKHMHICVLKLFSNGDVEWQRVFGSKYGADWAQFVQQTDEGGYIIAGRIDQLMLLLKLSSSGDVEWAETYGLKDDGYPDTAYFVEKAREGGYIVTGNTKSLGVGAADIIVLKVTPRGKIGPCEIAETADIKLDESTSVVPMDTNALTKRTKIVPLNTNVSPNNTNIKARLICWDLNQPPVGVFLKREINKSLFIKEAFHTISWKSNPYNSQYVITEYKVYKKIVSSEEVDSDYYLIESVPSNTLFYVDKHLNFEEKFAYVITSVDSEGRESPISLPIVNEVDE